MNHYGWIVDVIDDLMQFAERDGLENLRESFEHARKAIALDRQILKGAELTMSADDAGHRGLPVHPARNSRVSQGNHSSGATVSGLIPPLPSGLGIHLRGIPTRFS